MIRRSSLHRHRTRRGALLLEILLSVIIMSVSLGVIIAGMTASMRSARFAAHLLSPGDASSHRWEGGVALRAAPRAEASRSRIALGTSSHDDGAQYKLFSRPLSHSDSSVRSQQGFIFRVEDRDAAGRR